MKEETTEDILESLDKCYGVTFFRKKLKEYVEYIRIKKLLYLVPNKSFFVTSLVCYLYLFLTLILNLL